MNKDLSTWMKFFTADNLEEIEDELIAENEIMRKAIKKYKEFIADEKLMNTYKHREAFLVGQAIMMAKKKKYEFDEVSMAKRLKSINNLIKESKKEEQESIVKYLKKENIDIEIIKIITGFNTEEILKLQIDNEKL